jgi:hypothetical protein
MAPVTEGYMKYFFDISFEIDIKCMTLFNNICRQPDKAIEKQLAMRQLLNKCINWK